MVSPDKMLAELNVKLSAVAQKAVADALELLEPIGTETRFLRADGSESEFDVHDEACDCEKQTRQLYAGPWMAAGGWVSVGAVPPLSESGCVDRLPSRAEIEAEDLRDVMRRSPLTVYRLHWKSGGSSVASVGQTYDGTRWFAPSNWTTGTLGASLAHVVSTDWDKVAYVEQIPTDDTARSDG